MYGQFSLGPKWGPLLIRLVRYMVYRLYGPFWLDNTMDHISDMQCTEFPIPSFVGFCHILIWEFPCPGWAEASCSSGPQAGGTP